MTIVCALTGCEKDTENFEMTNPITFNADANFKRASTRSSAGIIDGTSFTYDDFGVYAYMTGKATGYLMTNVECNKKTDGYWYPKTGKYYWPVSDNASGVTATFTAFAPYAAPASFENDVATFNLTAGTVSTSGGTECTDYLYAKTTSNPTNDAVNIHFYHALAWVQFRARYDKDNLFVKDGDGVKIKSIKFSSNLTTDGTIALPTSTTAAFTSSSPAVTAGTTTADLEFGNASLSLTDAYRTLSDALLIPQNVPTNVTIVYDITINGVTFSDCSVTKMINDPDNDSNGGPDANTQADPTNYSTNFVKRFESGHKYIYNIYVTGSEIHFNVDVNNWATGGEFQIWDKDLTSYTHSFFGNTSMLTASHSLRA